MKSKSDLSKQKKAAGVKSHGKSQPAPEPQSKRLLRRKRYEAKTYKMGNVQGHDDPAKPVSPFKLPIRLPGWFPDGVDVPWHNVQRVFPEEIVGLKMTVPLPFPVEFCESTDPNNNNTTKKQRPHQWILGIPIKEPKSATAARNRSHLDCLVCDLAKLVRRYNASLYRLRRLHFHFDYQGCALPQRNPCGDPTTLPDPNSYEFRDLAEASELDWVKVTNALNDFLEDATDGYRKVRLMAADMVEVNGYIVSMRVVVQPRLHAARGSVGILEAGGSSSHVSISSAFSSS